ncbi:MAG TPA: glycosyltransferase family 2 protein, partial [Blastocatellia bacterium]|nr:glycosyltransferase family 2 protein [Blastocatellia bacterium]
MKFLFWVSIAVLLYTYIGYPLAIWILARVRRPAVRKAPITPRVSVVVACHKEAAAIKSRISNLLESDYPADLLEVIVVSDGSNDGTSDAARESNSDRVRVLEYAVRQGKAVALNVGVEAASGETVVFADARQSFSPDAIRQMVSNFADPRVGAVSGAYSFGDAGGPIAQGAGFYWKYEERIRRSEASFDSMIGATGAIYAIRRSLWQPLPPQTILDDVYTPMQIALKGYRVVFEPGATAYDVAPPSTSREFARKVRTLTGNYQLCQLMPRLLLPTHRLFFQFFSHKLTRLAAPFFLLALFASSLALAGEHLIYQITLLAQAAFYASVIAGWVTRRRTRKLRLFNIAYVFSVMNA